MGKYKPFDTKIDLLTLTCLDVLGFELRKDGNSKRTKIIPKRITIEEIRQVAKLLGKRESTIRGILLNLKNSKKLCSTFSEGKKTFYYLNPRVHTYVMRRLNNFKKIDAAAYYQTYEKLKQLKGGLKNARMDEKY